MIENVGYLDQTKNVITDDDFEYKTASFSVSDETPFYEVSDNFCLYNKFVCILNGVAKKLLQKLLSKVGDFLC